MGGIRAGIIGTRQTAVRQSSAGELQRQQRLIMVVVALGIIVGALLSPSAKVEPANDDSTPRVASPAAP